MRMTPIDKKDFIGEKFLILINQVKHTNQIKRFNDLNQIKQNTDKNSDKISQKNDKTFYKNVNRIEPNLIKTNMNNINNENINKIPKFQSLIYILPIKKHYSKNSNNNDNNLDYNLNNESINYNSNNMSKITKIDGRKYTILKYHRSSSPIINNNISNISNKINNYPILNYSDLTIQIINNNYITNKKNFNKTALNQYNNIWDISEEVIKNTMNVNRSNFKANPNRSYIKTTTIIYYTTITI